MAKVLDSRLSSYCYLKFIKLYNDVEDSFQRIKAIIYYEIKDNNKNYIATKKKEIIIYEGYEFKDTEYIIDTLSLILLPEIMSDKMEYTGENYFETEETEETTPTL